MNRVNRRIRNGLTQTFRRLLSIENLETRLAFSLWNPVDLDDVPATTVPRTQIKNFELYSLDTASLKQQVSKSPHEFSGQASDVVISIPRPDGQLQRFTVYSSPIMEEGLAAQYPEIQTFAGQGIDDPAATIRFDITPIGFHAQVLSPSGAYYIDPYATASDGLFVSYFKSANTPSGNFNPMPPLPHDLSGSENSPPAGEGDTAGRSGTILREYRLAVATTGEYSQFHAGLNPGVSAATASLSAVVVAVNRIDGVYRTEFSVSFRLIANNSAIIFTDANTDPYTNNNGFTMLGENQRTIDNIIGNANYDIGHVFSTGGGGVARLGSVGVDGVKAQGVTGLPAPIDDAFYIDYVAHEVGHQFGGNHSFNGVNGACGARNGSTAYEPGSGTTIMAYAGICGADDVQRNSDPYFHSISFDEAIVHVDNVIPSVGRRTPTGNSVPTVSAGADYVIPARTPFVLTATGADANAADVLTYSWEERDLGPAQALSAGDNGQSPLFRFWSPTTNPSRYFPRINDLVNNQVPVGEQLPTTTRTMNFRTVVRDNRFSGGGVNTDDMRVSVVDTGRAFRVTAPNTAVSWDGLTQQTVTWDVAGTTNAPISANLVDIYLSVDGGLTYPTVVAQNLVNNGQATIVVPNIGTNQARIMVRGDNNIFFDISDANFTIVPIPLIITVAPAVSSYTENNSPVLIADQTVVTLAQTLSGLSIDVNVIGGAQPGDSVTLTNSNGISVVNNNVEFAGQTIATLNSVASGISLTLNGNATVPSLEALIRSVAFSNSTDNPRSTIRTVQFLFGGGLSQTVNVNVTPLNDAPALSNVVLGSILEDVRVVSGQAIGQTFASAFSDPDENARLTGLVVVSNPENAAQGQWQYSTSGNLWSPIGTISGGGLVLSRATRLGFLPAPDYFGVPDPLIVKALDDTYTGNFSNILNNVRVDYDPLANLPTTISVNSSRVSLQVINVNDPPVANASSVEITGRQDQALNYSFAANLFTDIDSNVVWSLSSLSGSLPQWLSFNAQTRTLTGTPTNGDVGVYNLRATAFDGEFTVGVPVTLTVDNVNDAPEQLKITGGVVDEGRFAVQIGSLFANDPDGDPIFWTASDPRFTIRDGQVILVSPLDFENPADRAIRVTFRATDLGVPPLSTEFTVPITVRDVNEAYPQFDSTISTVLDGTVAGTLLDTLNAVDADTLQTVRYRLRSGDVSSFTLDPASGELRLAETINLFQKSQYKVFVEAFDNGTPSFSTTTQLVFNVLPSNFSVPEFDLNQQLVFAENLPADTVVGRIGVSDADNNPLRFELIAVDNGDMNWVILDPNTGSVRLSALQKFDFESGLQYALRVRVQEMVPGGNTIEGTIPIRIINVNDKPSGLGNLSIYPDRFGTPVSSAFSVIDQDRSSAGYSFSTSDSRFEIRGGRLALKATEIQTASTVGQALLVPVRVVDNGDISSVADLIATVTVVAARPWQNPVNSVDVNSDGALTSSDALAVINQLNSVGSRRLSSPRQFAELAIGDIDTTGDNFLSPADALKVINALNARSSTRSAGEGESLGDAQLQQRPAQTWLLAFNQLEEETLARRKR